MTDMEMEDAAESFDPLRPRLVRGQAVPVLCDEARDAQLLVVGSRGRGGFTGLLLGSVGTRLLHVTPCPLLVVPSTSRRDVDAVREGGVAGARRPPE